jgi:hypothetical protein
MAAGAACTAGIFITIVMFTIGMSTLGIFATGIISASAGTCMGTARPSA